jgi:hypothetical protein
MQGAARTVGRIPQRFKAGGKTYTLHAPSVGDLIVEMQAYMISLRGNPLLQAVDAVRRLPADLTPEQRELFAQRIWQSAEAASVRVNAPDPDEITRFENSLTGIAFRLWKCLQEDHADEFPDVESVLRLMELMVEEEGDTALDELVIKTRQATGEEDAKNSSGPTQSQGRASSNGPSGEAGPSSSNTLPTDSDSPQNKP